MSDIETGPFGEPIPNFCPFCGDDIEPRGAGWECQGHCNRQFWIE